MGKRLLFVVLTCALLGVPTSHGGSGVLTLDVKRLQSEFKHRNVFSLKFFADRPSRSKREVLPSQKFPPSPGVTIPILMYHYVQESMTAPHDGRKRELVISPARFREHMEWLAAHGYTPISPDLLISAREGRSPLPAKPVILTFDDGYEDAYTNVLPVLQEFGFTGVFYVVSGFIGKPGYLSAEHVRALDKQSMIVAAHTSTHRDLRTLAGSEVERELRESRGVLEGLLGHSVTHFAFPSGKYHRGVLRSLRALGYETAVTTRPGRAGPATSLLELPRIRMTERSEMPLLFP